MRDKEWNLAYGTTSLTFGPPDLDFVNMSAPDISDVEVRSDDVDRPRADGQSFGVDYRGSRIITFSLGVLGQSEVAVRSSLATLARAWRADEVRLTPGLLAKMTVSYAGTERLLYGRPRKFASSDEEAPQGFIPVTATFDCVDDLAYSTTESVIVLSIIGATGGGLVAPLASPLTTTASSDRSVAIAVHGDLPAYPVITITGPITDPVVEVIGLWKIALRANVAVGQTITIDTRPWGFATLPGAFTRASVRRSKALIPPGAYELAFRGTSSTGTASARVSWRDTYSTL